MIEAQSLSRIFAVEHAGEIFVNGCRTTREGFVGSAFTIGIPALAAFSPLKILFVTKRAVESAITAARTWRGNPVVVFALVVALRADRHTRDRVTPFCWFSIERATFLASS